MPVLQRETGSSHLPEKKIPSTAAKATSRSAKLSELQHTQAEMRQRMHVKGQPLTTQHSAEHFGSTAKQV